MRRMNRSEQKWAAFLAVSASALGGVAHAAAIPMSDATYSGSFTAGSPENITGNASVTGITYGTTTLTNLVGATANAVVTSNTLSSLGTIPASANAAVSGLSANDGVNNIATGNFQFGQTLTADTRFFIIESAPVASTVGDPTTVTLLDSTNTAVGTYTLSLAATDFQSTLPVATLTYTTNQNTNYSQKLGGVVFSLADFTGTGSLANVTGISLSSGTLDPNVVGIATVPEPASIAALSMAGLIGLKRRRTAR